MIIAGDSKFLNHQLSFFIFSVTKFQKLLLMFINNRKERTQTCNQWMKSMNNMPCSYTGIFSP